MLEDPEPKEDTMNDINDLAVAVETVAKGRSDV